jgi:glycosyltransferase involved in cell wall biosynthesis
MIRSLSSKSARWVCVQLGAREHYAVARALASFGELRCLLTDAWTGPHSAAGLFRRQLRERYHPELADASVRAWTAGLVAFELLSRLKKLSGWNLILARNAWFQTRVARWLARRAAGWQSARQATVLFSYSYTALAPFHVAKTHGWRTVLGQIDPGPPEERIVKELRQSYPQYAGKWQPAPEEYWAAWREECNLADVVMVNSEWSRKALVTEGVPAEKIAVVPLAYEREVADCSAGTWEESEQGVNHRACGEELPGACPKGSRLEGKPFSRQRPLRVLFLGQANLRKGIQDVVAAAEFLSDDPVVFDIVGPHDLLPSSLPANLTLHGPVPRGEAGQWYREADLFVLPTHSDGFALTQLEAMAHGLPVITTSCCGSVVEPGRSGWIVPAGCPTELARAVMAAVNDPVRLAEMGCAAQRRSDEFSIDALSGRLTKLTEKLFSHASPAEA